MKTKGAAFLRGAVLTLIVLAALAVLGFAARRTFSQASGTAAVELPPPRPDEQNVGPTATPPLSADVTPETVVAVLRTIPPVRSYSRAVIAETLWEGGSSTEILLCWVRGDDLRLRAEGKNLLSTADGLWVWYDDAPEVFAAPAAAAAEKTRLMRLLDWEALLSAEGEIVGAAYTEFEEEPCVYLSVRGGAFDYVSELYVSIETGLLVAADRYEDEKCVFRLRTSGLEISTPDESRFVPPETAG